MLTSAGDDRAGFTGRRFYPAVDVTRVSAVPAKETVKIDDAKNRWRGCRNKHRLNGLRQANLLLIAYASSEGSGEPAHPRSLARTSAARSYKQ